MYHLELELELQFEVTGPVIFTTKYIYYSQIRLREAEMEKKRAIEEARLRAEEKKKTDMQVEAEAGRRLQLESLMKANLENSNQGRRNFWEAQEDSVSDVGSHDTMDSGERGEWSGTSGMRSSWLARQVCVWCIFSPLIILLPSRNLYIILWVC